MDVSKEFVIALQVRMQAATSPSYTAKRRSCVSLFKQIYSSEGLRGLYRVSEGLRGLVSEGLRQLYRMSKGLRQLYRVKGAGE